MNTSSIFQDPYSFNLVFLKKSLASTYWSCCSYHQSFTSPLINNNTTYFLLYDNHSNYETFKYFGCLAYAFTLQHNRSKFDPQSKYCVFHDILKKPNVTFYMILTLTNFSFLGMLVLYESYFPLLTSHDYHPLLPIPTIHHDNTDI